MAELRERLEKAFIDAFLVFGKDPSFQVTKDKDHIRTYSNTNEAFLNNVFQVPAGLTRERIDSITREFHGNQFLWTLGPSNAKLLETARLLESCGHMHIGASPGMILSKFEKAKGSELVIEVVKDAKALTDWFLVFKEGFGMSQVATDFCHALFKNQSFFKDPAWRLILGRHGEKPVACGSTYFDGRYLGLYNIAVLPESRNRGFGAAITSSLIETSGMSDTTPTFLFSSPEGFPVYKRIGFETVCTIERFFKL